MPLLWALLPRVAVLGGAGGGGRGRAPGFLRSRLALAFLAPPIQAAILDGTQPAGLTLARILRTGVPLDWSEQAHRFGFEG